MKNLIVGLVIIIILGIGAYFLLTRPSAELKLPADGKPTGEQTNGQAATTTAGGEPAPAIPTDETKTVLGQSVEGRSLIAYHFGSGPDEIVFVGGVHGGYSPNTALVAYELMDYLESTPTVIPSNVRVTVIPVFNPDGLNKVVGTSTRFSINDVPTSREATVPGRFNANTVDLNRNFDCDWAASSKWQSTTVSGGASAFSEPEALALKQYIEAEKPKAALVWYSAAGGVFASDCHNGVMPETLTLTNLYARASGYQAYETFDFYEITGDMVNWLAGQKIPAISVLLTNHRDTEWLRNKAGIEALLKHYAN